ncbi:hypothetical protein KP79_PYT08188 [Mizuhopecten yessoensis]|uniref:Uncharacterized protein n=1 Tax=Mizuhopecten yessoensis TaxID=6573 RepID=A0A210QF80_MIZYE|nr:hypothetical protein KP79_PYT08188 [Mizuhopecten yessoensis]
MIDFLPMENTTSTKCGSLLIGALTKDLVTSPDVEISTARPTKDSNDALFYIITVLLFYACSIVILMVKYIRREKQEAEFRNYFHEYVLRDQFRQPQYQNLSYMCHLMKLPTKGSSKMAPELSPKSTENHFSLDHVDVLEEKQKFLNETSV